MIKHARVMPSMAHHPAVSELSLAIPSEDNVRNEVLRHHRQRMLLVGAAKVDVAPRGHRLMRRIWDDGHRGRDYGRDKGA